MLGVLLSASCQGDEFESNYLMQVNITNTSYERLLWDHIWQCSILGTRSPQDSIQFPGVRVSDVAPILGAEWASLKIPVHDSVIGGCWATKKTINSTDPCSYDFSSTQISSFLPYESQRLVFRSNNLKTFNSWKTFSVKIKINLQSDPMSLCTSAIKDSLSDNLS